MTTAHSEADDSMAGPLGDAASPAEAGRRPADVVECYRRGGEVLVENLWILLLMGVTVGAVVVAGWGWLRVPVIGGLLSFAFGALVSTPLTWGFYDVCLRAVRGEPVEPRNIVRVYDRYSEAALAAAVVTGLVLIGFALLVVPGVILLCRLAFVPYLIVEGRLSATEALWESAELTAGHGLTIFGLLVVRLMLYGIGLIPLGLGLVPAGVWSDLAMATLYHRVVESRPPPTWSPASSAAV